jgi:hypothetical protein
VGRSPTCQGAVGGRPLLYDDNQMTRGAEEIQSCVDRILQGGTFRNAPSSRRLLKYLVDHSLAGDADQLKEYTIGVDSFNKPGDYDPRLDSTVRIQIGRLRQKLAEYYREEGKDDELIVDLPKGRFSLICEPRSAAAAAAAAAVSAEEAPEPAPSQSRWRLAAIALAVVCLIMMAVAIYSYSKLRSGQNASAVLWSSDLAELWRPFLNTGRPLIIAVGNPLFLQFENKALYRDLSIEKPDDLLKSPQFSALSKALGSRESRPVHYYAAVGDAVAMFLLGQRLGPRHPGMSVVRSSQLQWQQLADANVLFLGPPRFFGDKLGSLPVPLEITEVADGFLVVHPRSGEPSLFKFRDPPGFFAEDGEACVLITHTAGPVGNTDVMTFASNSTFGRVGAIDAFTDAGFTKTLVARMRDASGHIPQYFQVLLKVKYKGGVPTETAYLLHRELRRRN